MGLIFLIVFLVVCLPGLCGYVAENGRSPRLQKIAASHNWHYVSRAWLTKSQQVGVRNVLKGHIKSIEAKIFDMGSVPAYEQIYIEPEHVHWHAHTTYLLLTLPGCALPRFHLFPKTWLDQWTNLGMSCRNFTVYGDDVVRLQEQFAGAWREHYEQQRGLHIRTIGKHVLLWFDADDYYLPATKELYGDLMGEGKIVLDVLGELMAE